MPSMAAVGAMHGLGCLIIDEVQHLSVAKSGGATKMLNFFTELSNTMGIPVILLGTPQSLDVLGSEFRCARRATGHPLDAIPALVALTASDHRGVQGWLWNGTSPKHWPMPPGLLRQ